MYVTHSENCFDEVPSPVVVVTKNQGSTLGIRKFENEFINRNVNDFQYDPICTLTNAFK